MVLTVPPPGMSRDDIGMSRRSKEWSRTSHAAGGGAGTGREIAYDASESCVWRLVVRRTAGAGHHIRLYRSGRRGAIGPALSGTGGRGVSPQHKLGQGPADLRSPRHTGEG